MAGGIRKLSIYRAAAVGMPLLAIVAMTAMGTELMSASHALTPEAATSHSSIATNVDLPASAATSCCSLSTTTLSVHSGTAKRVTLSVRIRNTTNATEQISPGLQFNLIDMNGAVHPYTAAYLSPDTVIGGPLGAGQSTTLSLDFNLAPSETPRYLQFQYDAASQQVLVGLPS